MRTVEATELKELEELAREVWYESYEKLLGKDQVKYMLKRFQCETAFNDQLKEGYIYRLYEDNGKPVGYSASKLEGDRIFLSKLYLKKEYHGHGIGKMMIEDVISLYPSATKIYLTVNKYNPTYNIYKHLGFEVIDAVVTDIEEGYVMDDYVMQRNIL